jgi:hypothetical protein
MQDVRWSRLAEILVAEGWVWREDALYAPNATLWFEASADDPGSVQFRDRMTLAHEATAPAPDRRALQADLVSLVGALDAILEN